MRVNVYAEEMTDRVQIIGKEIDGHQFTGLRFYLELPATVDGKQYQAPFMHRPGDDDSSAVTFWGKRDLRMVLRQALAMLDEHYASRPPVADSAEKAVCVWSQDGGDDWRTGCGRYFTLNDQQTPEDCAMKFCYHCGKPLEQILEEEITEGTR